MKKLFLAFTFATSAAFGATTVPVQLISPAGSTSGQAIVSSGASTAPAWTAIVNSVAGQTGAVTLTGIGLGSGATPTFFGLTLNGSTAHGVAVGGGNGVPLTFTAAGAAGQPLLSGGASADPSYGTLAVANGGTGATSAASALTNLGAVPLAGGTMTGGLSLSYSTAQATLNDTSGANASTVMFQSAGVNTWTVYKGSAGNFNVGRYSGGAFVDNPISVAAATGAVTFTSSIQPSSTGGIVGTTSANSANAGSVGEYQTATTSGTALTSTVPANATSLSLTAGDWEVWGVVQFVPAGSTQMSLQAAGISTTSATLPANGFTSLAGIAPTAGSGSSLPVASARVNVSSTTTVYLVAQGNFTVSTCTVTGIIRARRLR